MFRCLWLIPIYILAVAGLMYINVILLGFGDSKFPKNIDMALGFYFPLWLLVHIPHVVLGWGMLSSKRLSKKANAIQFALLLLSILGLIEVSFLLDLPIFVFPLELMITYWIALFLRRDLLHT